MISVDRLEDAIALHLADGFTVDISKSLEELIVLQYTVTIFIK